MGDPMNEETSRVQVTFDDVQQTEQVFVVLVRFAHMADNLHLQC